MGGYFGAFVGGVAKTRLADMQAKDDEESALRMLEKQEEIRERMRQKADEMRVAAKQAFMKKGSSTDQSPWVSKDAAGYTTPQGTPDQVMMEEFNNMGKPISTRPASQSESEGYLQEQNALAANKAAEEAKAVRQNMLDASRLRKDADISATSQKRNQYYDDKMANPDKYKSNPAAPKGPDYDKMIDNANRVLGSIEDPEIKAQLQGKIKEAISVINPVDGAPGNAEEAAQMLVIALREARQREAMMGGKKKSTGNSAEPTASGKTLEDK